MREAEHQESNAHVEGPTCAGKPRQWDTCGPGAILRPTDQEADGSALYRDKELAKIEVNPEDVDIIANQFLVRGCPCRAALSAKGEAPGAPLMDPNAGLPLGAVKEHTRERPQTPRALQVCSLA
jgi:hypothetical protein